MVLGESFWDGLCICKPATTTTCHLKELESRLLSMPSDPKAITCPCVSALEREREGSREL